MSKGGAPLRPGDERDISIGKFEIEAEDVFHLKTLYESMHDWLLEEGFKDIDGFEDRFEQLYWERTGATGAKEFHIWWRVANDPETSKYYRQFLRVDFQGLNSKEVEIMHKGQKVKTNKTDLIIRMEGILQLDPNNKMGKGFWKGFELLYRKRFFEERREQFRDELYNKVYRLSARIKAYLKLKTPYKAPRPFRPELGLLE
ncbi:MAG TPA: hypothetical protein VJG90_06685 [Candidatus Nanoarchaeia archaeon]|nr:hypothetical protein [Candidatus Nanoarchaeia archaeon]